MFMSVGELKWSHVQLACRLHCCPRCGPWRAGKIREWMGRNVAGTGTLYLLEDATRQPSRKLTRQRIEHLWLRRAYGRAARCGDPGHMQYLAVEDFSGRGWECRPVTEEEGLAWLDEQLRRGINKRGTSRGWELGDSRVTRPPNPEYVYVRDMYGGDVPDTQVMIRVLYDHYVRRWNPGWPRWGEWPGFTPGEFSLPPMAPGSRERLIRDAGELLAGRRVYVWVGLHPDDDLPWEGEAWPMIDPEEAASLMALYRSPTL